MVSHVLAEQRIPNRSARILVEHRGSNLSDHCKQIIEYLTRVFMYTQDM